MVLLFDPIARSSILYFSESTACSPSCIIFFHMKVGKGRVMLALEMEGT
jgi:hypothetical protein